jgi:hypothetical protein
MLSNIHIKIKRILYKNGNGIRRTITLYDKSQR